MTYKQTVCPKCKEHESELTIVAVGQVLLRGFFDPLHENRWDGSSSWECSHAHWDKDSIVFCDCGWHGTIDELILIDLSHADLYGDPDRRSN